MGGMRGRCHRRACGNLAGVDCSLAVTMRGWSAYGIRSSCFSALRRSRTSYSDTGLSLPGEVLAQWASRLFLGL
jgi:hypothetical protein